MAEDSLGNTRWHSCKILEHWLQLRTGKVGPLFTWKSVYKCQDVFSFCGILCLSAIPKWCIEVSLAGPSSIISVTLDFFLPRITLFSADGAVFVPICCFQDRFSLMEAFRFYCSGSVKVQDKCLNQAIPCSLTNINWACKQVRKDLSNWLLHKEI